MKFNRIILFHLFPVAWIGPAIVLLCVPFMFHISAAHTAPARWHPWNWTAPLQWHDTERMRVMVTLYWNMHIDTDWLFGKISVSCNHILKNINIYRSFLGCLLWAVGRNMNDVYSVYFREEKVNREIFIKHDITHKLIQSPYYCI